ncbi:MAG: molybdate ABC transporter substrate-binding protein [Acidimicrobiales bacterium]
MSVPPFDHVEDLHGDPLSADLVLFMNGNQFMAMEEVVAAFSSQLAPPQAGLRAAPAPGGVFYETLPPGVLVRQLRSGGLSMGSLVLSVRPDVIALSPDAMAGLASEGLVAGPIEYASNNLTMLVIPGLAGKGLVGQGLGAASGALAPREDPRSVNGLADLAEPGLRVAMPDPETEGVGRLIRQALVLAGGEELAEEVFGRKVAAGETMLTSIHHRESVAWLLAGAADVAPLWSTEARYHLSQGVALTEVGIVAEHNVVGRYAIAEVAGCAHPGAARAFVDFVTSPECQQVYTRYGFSGPVEAGC